MVTTCRSKWSPWYLYPKAVSYAVRFRASDLYFSISKTNEPAYAVQICKIRPGIFRFENPMTQVVGFWAKNPTTWVIRFSNRKMVCSLNSRCYPLQQTAVLIARSMSWMATQLYSHVASRPTLGRRAACSSVARLQSPGAVSRPEAKRSALATHLSADTYEYS